MNKKSTLLLVLNILKEYSDEDHFLTQSKIASLIHDLYHVNIERKTVGSTLNALQELDYDIVKRPGGGVALFERSFDLTEAIFLLDSLESDLSLPSGLTKQIEEKLSADFSRYQKEELAKKRIASTNAKTKNRDTLYTLSIIEEAKKRGKRMAFRYYDYDQNGSLRYRYGNHKYIVSPYFVFSRASRHYLVCNYREKYRPLQIFKIDHIVDPEIKEDWDLKPLSSLSGLPKDFEIENYVNEHFYVLDGDTIQAEFLLDGPSAVSALKDWFGEQADIKTSEGKIYASIKANENALYYWVMQYSDSLTVTMPEKFVNRVRHGLEEALKRYE